MPTRFLALALALAAAALAAPAGANAAATPAPPADAAAGPPVEGAPGSAASPAQVPARAAAAAAGRGPALGAPAAALIADATERLLAGETLPPGYLVQLQALPADQRLLVMVHLRRSGLLDAAPMPADWVLAPQTQPDGAPR